VCSKFSFAGKSGTEKIFGNFPIIDLDKSIIIRVIILRALMVQPQNEREHLK